MTQNKLSDASSAPNGDDVPVANVKTQAEMSNRANVTTLPSVTSPNKEQMSEAMQNMIASAQENQYQSAAVLMRRLADAILEWRQQLPEDEQPAILAILQGGMQIHVERLAQESFHGIRIEGRMGDSPCMLLAHQSSIQLLCYVEKVQEEKQRRRIGFIIDGEEEEV